MKINVVPANGGITNIKNNLFGEGEEVYFEAVPNQYYYFDFWSGDIKSNQSVISLNIYSNLNVNANFKLLDSDNDGIPDRDDLCDKTIIGTLVDENGCSNMDIDYDNDGVYNHLDICPNTPPYTTVNSEGCQLVERDGNGYTLKATFRANEYLGEVILFEGDSLLIVRNWEHLRSLGPSTYNKNVKIITSYIDELRELCSLPCQISDKFDMSVWDLSNVRSMYFTFWNTNGFNQDLSNWDVSNVESMEGIFFHAYNLNVDLLNWDVGKVKNMKRMFRGAFYANPDLSLWDVSNVTNMKEMFHGTDISQDLKYWDVSKVTDMEGMFFNAKYFNQDLSIWDVGKVIECDNFYENTESWSLPKPSFIKCNPDG